MRNTGELRRLQAHGEVAAPGCAPRDHRRTDHRHRRGHARRPGGLPQALGLWQQFARKVLELRAPPTWEPQFDAMSPKQEALLVQFCAEIAGPKGEPGRPPDPVRLLEMAQALYEAERQERGP